MKRAILFPGQGSQTIGMGADLYESNQTYKEVFDSIDKNLDFSLKSACFEGTNMDKSEYVQPAIYAHSIALYKALNIKADVYAGLSLGEYTALTATNMQQVVQGAQLVYKRGHIMDNAIEPGKGGMLSVLGLSIEQVEAQLEGLDNVWVANHLSEKQIVIAGQKQAISDISPSFERLGAKTIELNTSGPFHTQMLKEASDEFIKLLQKAQFNKPKEIIYSNYTAKPYECADAAPQLLAMQMCSRVRWHQIIETLISQKIMEFVEIGPSMVLTKMLKRRLKGSDVHVVSIRDAKTLEKYLANQKEKQNG